MFQSVCFKLSKLSLFWLFYYGGSKRCVLVIMNDNVSRRREALLSILLSSISAQHLVKHQLFECLKSKPTHGPESVTINACAKESVQKLPSGQYKSNVVTSQVT